MTLIPGFGDSKIFALHFLVLDEFLHDTTVYDLAVVQDVEMISHLTGHVKVLLNQDDHAVLFYLVDGFDYNRIVAPKQQV